MALVSNAANMPPFVPGMEGPRSDPYDVVTFAEDGRTTVGTKVSNDTHRRRDISGCRIVEDINRTSEVSVSDLWNRYFTMNMKSEHRLRNRLDRPVGIRQDWRCLAAQLQDPQ